MSLRDPKTQKVLLTAVLCGLALWSYFLSDLLPFGYRKQAEKVRALGATQETVAAELEKARRAVADLPQLEREQADLERKWTQAEMLLPTDKEMAHLLTQITQAGEQAGVDFKLFKPGAQRPQEFYNENPVDVQVEGGYHQVGVMLARLANMQRIVNVAALSLDATKQKSRRDRGKQQEGEDEDRRTDHTLVASFTATAYSLRDPTQEPPAAAPAEKGGKRAIRAASTGATANATNAADAGATSRTTPGGVVKKLGSKAKGQSNAEGAQ